MIALCALYIQFLPQWRVWLLFVAPVAAATLGHAGALLSLATLDMCPEDLLKFKYLMADSWQ